MIVVDSSIWIDHLRSTEQGLASLLSSRRVLMHPFVLGEIALGNFAQRRELISNLSRLREAPVASHKELLAFVEGERLFGAGIGYVDAHLLASTCLLPGAYIWTRDKRLAAVADRMGIAIPTN